MLLFPCVHWRLGSTPLYIWLQMPLLPPGKGLKMIWNEALQLCKEGMKLNWGGGSLCRTRLGSKYSSLVSDATRKSEDTGWFAASCGLGKVTRGCQALNPEHSLLGREAARWHECTSGVLGCLTLLLWFSPPPFDLSQTAQAGSKRRCGLGNECC